MSDLQCPADIVVARHGEAEYEHELLSDDGGSLTPRGRLQAGALAERLADRHVATVYTSSLARAVQTAEIVAARLSCGVRVREGLAELSVGNLAGHADLADAFTPILARWRQGDLAARIPGAESGEEVVARISDELTQLADLYRGETVLAVSHGGVMSLALPILAANLPDTYAVGQPLGDTTAVDLVADSDGWRCLSWGDRTVGG